MQVKATLQYGDEVPDKEFLFEIDYVAELYDAMNDEVSKLPQEGDGPAVEKWTRAVIEIVR
jgi:hypothetical protein